MNQKFVTQLGKTNGTSSANPPYDGPYIYKGSGWTGRNEDFALIKNPSYYDKANVKSKKIDIQVIKTQTTAVQLYKQGKLDLVSLNTPDLYNANKAYTKNKKLIILKEAITNFIEVNQTQAQLLPRLCKTKTFVKPSIWQLTAHQSLLKQLVILLFLQVFSYWYGTNSNW